MKQLGRPNDKLKYIGSILNTLNCSLGADEFGHMDEGLETALAKLNAKELIVLNTYIAKQNRLSLEEVVSLLPSKTPAQKDRVHSAVELYNKLEQKNENYARTTTRESYEEVTATTGTDTTG